MAHALFICLTHHHDTPLSYASAVSANDNHSRTTTDAGSDAGCLSCRLQRQFVADPQTGTISVETVAEARFRETPLTEPLPQRLATSLFGRAPPLV